MFPKLNPFWRPCLAFLAAFVAHVVLMSAASAQDAQRCAGGGGIPPDLQIKSCTTLIQSGQETPPQDLAKLFNYRCYAHIKKGENDRAIEDCGQAIKLAPDYRLAYNNRGNAYKNKGDFDRALKDQDQAISLSRNFAIAFNDRATLYQLKGDLDRAIKDYDQAIALGIVDARVFYNRGDAFVGKDELDRALLDYTEARRIDPAGEARYRSHMCWAQAALGEDIDAAVADCNASLQLAPEPYAYAARGFAYLKMGLLEEARADLDEALAQEPKVAGSLYSLGLVKRGSGDLSGGDADIAAANAINPTIADEYERYGLIP